LAAAAAGLTFTACDRDTILPQDSVLSEDASSIVIRESIGEDFSHIIANAPDLVEALAAECLKETTGEREVLYVNLKDIEVTPGRTFSDLLQSMNPDMPHDYFSHQVVREDPRLALYLHKPLAMSQSEFLQRISSITKVYAAEGEDMSRLTYFQNGNRLTNSTGVEESDPVFVFAESDRIQFDQKVSDNVVSIVNVAEFEGTTYYSARYPSPMHFDEYVATFGEPEERSLSARSSMRDQLPAAFDLTQRILYKDFPDPWYHSKFELRTSMVGVSSGRISHEFEIHKHQKGDWVFLSDQAPSIKWKIDLANGDEGHRVKYHYSDKDGGSGFDKFKVSYTTKVKIPGGFEASATPSVEFGRKDDDFLGESFAYYVDWVEPSSWGHHYISGANWEHWINIDYP